MNGLDDVLSKIKKLLALATSSNVHEASLAAARAAKLMQDYQISEAALESADDKPDEPVGEHHLDETERPGKKIYWRMRIAGGCALVCGCKAYWRGPQIILVGRDSDVKAARYLFGLISSQVEPLAELCFSRDCGWGDKRRWMHAFRLGCAEAIRGRLERQHAATMADLRTRATSGLAIEEGEGSASTAIMVIDRRLAKVDRHLERLGLKPAKGATISSSSGYHSGRSAGQTVHLGGGAKGSLGPGAKALRG